MCVCPFFLSVCYLLLNEKRYGHAVCGKRWAIQSSVFICKNISIPDIRSDSNGRTVEDSLRKLVENRHFSVVFVKVKGVNHKIST